MNFTFFEIIMTQILHQHLFVTFLESKYCQNHGQCSEKAELQLKGGLSRG